MDTRLLLAIILLALCSVILGFDDFAYDDYGNDYYGSFDMPYRKPNHRRGIKNYGINCDIIFCYIFIENYR